jgi:hypothetical protein
MTKMLGSVHAIKLGVGIAAAAIMLVGTSVGSLAQNGTTLTSSALGSLSATGVAQGP